MNVDSIDLLMSVSYPEGTNERTDPTELINSKLTEVCWKIAAVRMAVNTEHGTIYYDTRYIVF